MNTMFGAKGPELNRAFPIYSKYRQAFLPLRRALLVATSAASAHGQTQSKENEVHTLEMPMQQAFARPSHRPGFCTGGTQQKTKAAKRHPCVCDMRSRFNNDLPFQSQFFLNT